MLSLLEKNTETICSTEKAMTCKCKVFRKKPKKYNKFSSEHLIVLKEIYSENRYPSRKEIERLANEMGEKMEKIQNWFKHQRKKEVVKGVMKYEKKNTFSKDQHNFLLQKYNITRNPTGQQYQELATQINCKVKHVKNWFSYKRKQALKIQKNNKHLINEETLSSPSTQPSKQEEMCEPTNITFPIYNSEMLQTTLNKIHVNLALNNTNITNTTQNIVQTKNVQKMQNPNNAQNVSNFQNIQNSENIQTSQNSQNQQNAENQQNGQNQQNVQNLLGIIKCPVPVIAIPLNSNLGLNLLLKSNVNATIEANNQMLQNLYALYGQIIKNQQYLKMVNVTLGNKINNYGQ